MRSVSVQLRVIWLSKWKKKKTPSSSPKHMTVCSLLLQFLTCSSNELMKFSSNKTKDLLSSLWCCAQSWVKILISSSALWKQFHLAYWSVELVPSVSDGLPVKHYVECSSIKTVLFVNLFFLRSFRLKKKRETGTGDGLHANVFSRLHLTNKCCLIKEAKETQWRDRRKEERVGKILTYFCCWIFSSVLGDRFNSFYF